MHPGTRADINDMVRRPNRIFIMLYHNHGVTEITQMDQRFQQTFIVTLMQTDGRFIQHIHHANQPGTNLAGQTNTLCFTARQGFCGTGHRQIIQPDIHQKTQAIADLFQHFLCNFGSLAAEFQVFEETHGMTNTHI